jgi:hypothetical protein
MSKRKERKKRKAQLIYEWSLEVNKEIHKSPERGHEETNEALYILFQKFCKEKGIDKPQDKTLRESIIIGAQQLLELVAEEYYKTHPNKPDKGGE